MGAMLPLAALIAGGAAARADDLGPLNLVGTEHTYLEFAGGLFDVDGHRGTNTTGEVSGEWRYGKKFFYIGPALGVLANFQGATDFYGGFYSDLKFGKVVITPLGAVSWYNKGGSLNLGGTFQFRLELGASYELDSGSRVGLKIDHLSSAGINKVNPGESGLMVTYAIPLSY